MRSREMHVYFRIQTRVVASTADGKQIVIRTRHARTLSQSVIRNTRGFRAKFMTIFCEFGLKRCFAHTNENFKRKCAAT